MASLVRRTPGGPTRRLARTVPYRTRRERSRRSSGRGRTRRGPAWRLRKPLRGKSCHRGSRPLGNPCFTIKSQAASGGTQPAIAHAANTRSARRITHAQPGVTVAPPADRVCDDSRANAGAYASHCAREITTARQTWNYFKQFQRLKICRARCELFVVSRTNRAEDHNGIPGGST